MSRHLTHFSSLIPVTACSFPICHFPPPMPGEKLDSKGIAYSALSFQQPLRIHVCNRLGHILLPNYIFCTYIHLFFKCNVPIEKKYSCHLAVNWRQPSCTRSSRNVYVKFIWHREAAETKQLVQPHVCHSSFDLHLQKYLVQIQTSPQQSKGLV